MGGDEAKVFVGGLSQETNKDSLRNHFLQYGTVTDCVVMYDAVSSRSRGFGFVSFDTPDIIPSILSIPQVIDGKEVECKKACPREIMAARQQSAYQSRQSSNFKTTKIFVGGLPDLTIDEFRIYFSKYGKVIDAVLMTDRVTNKPRGFGFITFESADVVDEVVRRYQDHQIKDKWVEVKKAQTRDQLSQRHVDGMGGRGGYGGFGGAVFGGMSYGDYDNYRHGGYHPGGGYDNRRQYPAPGYDPYAPAGYGGPAGYIPQEDMVQGSRRGGAGGGPLVVGAGGFRGGTTYRGGGDPYSSMGTGVSSYGQPYNGPYGYNGYSKGGGGFDPSSPGRGTVHGRGSSVVAPLSSAPGIRNSSSNASTWDTPGPYDSFGSSGPDGFDHSNASSTFGYGPQRVSAQGVSGTGYRGPY